MRSSLEVNHGHLFAGFGCEFVINKFPISYAILMKRLSNCLSLLMFDYPSHAKLQFVGLHKRNSMGFIFNANLLTVTCTHAKNQAKQ